MPRRLRKLKITRVAVCDQGANPDADILLFKRADAPEEVAGAEASVTKDLLASPHAEPDGDEAPPMDYASRTQQQELWSALYDKWHRFCDTFYDVIGDCDADNVPHLPILVTSIEQFRRDVAALLTDTGVLAKMAAGLDTLQALAKVGAVMSASRKQRLQEAIAALQAILDEAMPCETLTEKGAHRMAEKVAVVDGNVAQQEMDALRKRAETAEARVTALEQQAAQSELELKKAKQTPEEQEAEYLASLPEAVRKKFLADQEEKMDLRKRLQESEDRAEEATYIQKTAKYRQFGLVPDNWRILKAIERMPEEERTELLRLMEAAAEQARTSELFKAKGSEGNTRGVEGATAEEQLDTLIKSYQEEKSCDFDTAWKAVVKAKPELWERNIAEKRSSNRLDIR